MTTHYIFDTPSQHVASENRADALRILSEYVRSFDTDPETSVPEWKNALPPYNSKPYFL